MINSRLWMVMCGAGFFLVVILIRLVDVQLVRGQAFADQADDNRFFTVRIPAERGIFLDRYDQPLVLNHRTYAKRVDSDAIYTKYEPVSQTEALQLMATDSAAVQFGLERSYLHSPATSHVLGYVGAVTPEDLLRDNTLAVSDLIGKIGLEQQFDEQVRGRAGKEVYEINAMGQRQRLVEKLEAQAGTTIKTSLDPFLSEVAWEALGNKTGAVVIMDAQTGQILSLVSKPGYDANILSTSFIDPLLEAQRRQQLTSIFQDERKPFFNRAVGGAYPPGSVFKIVTALGGLEADAITEGTTVVDEGVLKVGEYEYANWYYTQYGRTEGSINVRRALARSNDIYFYKTAEALGPVKLAEFARLFGYGQPTGLELQAEAAGTVPDPAWKERVIGEPWYLGNTFHMGIGQGDVLVSPVQVAQMTQAVANHGALCQPSLLANNTSTSCRELGLTEEHLEVVLSGMIDVCSAGGTAYPLFPHNAEYVGGDVSSELDSNALIAKGAVACKTGTAEFGGVDEQGYRRTHGWLTAIIGTQPIIDQAKTVEVGQEPDAHAQWLAAVKDHGLPSKLVMVALVESDDTVPFREGSRDATPVVKTIIDWMMAGEKATESSTAPAVTTVDESLGE